MTSTNASPHRSHAGLVHSLASTTASEPLSLVAELATDLSHRAISAAAGDGGDPRGASPGDEGPTEVHPAATLEDLEAVAALLAHADRCIAAIVLWMVRQTRSGVIAAAGLTTDSWLRAVAGRTGADAGMLAAAAERLADMPAVLAAFARGAVSWGAVRGMVAATRSLTAAQRGWLDDQLASDDRLSRLHADDLVAAAERLVDEARPDLAEAQRERTRQAQYVALQPAADGSGGRIHGSLDAETFAVVQAALDTTTTADGTAHDDRPDTDRSDADHDRHDDGRPGPGDARRHSNVEALRLLSLQRLRRTAHCPEHAAPLSGTPSTDDCSDGDEQHDESSAGAAVPSAAAPAGGNHRCCPGGAPSTARPSMLIVVDAATLAGDGHHSSDPARGVAELLWRADRPAAVLSSDAAQRLACDATMRVVVTDGAVPLAVSEPYAKVSAALRAALTVRDGGCRFTGCQRSAERCDAHHLVPREQGGSTSLDNLALLCSAHHHAIHEGGWTATLHDDATMTFARRRVMLTSPPRAHRHRPSDRPPPRGRPSRRRPAGGAPEHDGASHPTRPDGVGPAHGRADVVAGPVDADVVDTEPLPF